MKWLIYIQYLRGLGPIGISKILDIPITIIIDIINDLETVEAQYED